MTDTRIILDVVIGCAIFNISLGILHLIGITIIDIIDNWV